VFNAYSLAELRDAYWLNCPPSDLGSGYQGFDLWFPVNCKDGVYAEEEGNYGKLLRIWKGDFPHRPSTSPVLSDTETEYLSFQEKVVIQGFWNLCDYHLPRLSGNGSLNKMLHDGKAIGAKAGQFGFFSNSLLDSRNVLSHMMDNDVTYAVVMTDKYVCSGYRVNNGELEQLFRGLKPKRLNRPRFGLV
jgi:hypothetical protein